MPDSELMAHPWIQRWKLDVTAYHRLGETGILAREERVELIEGQLLLMAPIGAGHFGTVLTLSQLLFQAAGGRALVSVQGPIRLDQHNEPQPDVALLRPRPGGYRDALATPADVLLLIEVADSSLRFDRQVKLPLYARHGIAEVWIVDLVAMAVDGFRGPTPQGYVTTTHAGRGAAVDAAALPGLRLRVDDILG